ncbi:MAG: IS1595 family transposase [Nitrosopumilaceae archaeon]|nr:IS1595 family transposase [Nitrosopumilaceae archaeon]
MVHRLRESCKKLAGVDEMEGPVEIDESYFGGSDSNRHRDKKGTAKKTAVVGVKDRTTNKIAAKPVPETTKARLEHFIEGHVNDTAKKYTDENPAYGSLSNHESCNHSVGQYVRGMAHTNGLESFWSMVKRGYDGTFHHFSEGHMHRYVNEFAGRHNIRSMDTIDMMGTVAETMAGERLTYQQLIGHG